MSRSSSRQSPASAATSTTATTTASSSSSSSNAFETSTLNDIDGDDDSHVHDDYDEDDDEESNVSDLDSILAMAKRLDDASIISDPSIIEGTTPHYNINNNHHYGGVRGTRGGNGGGGGSSNQYSRAGGGSSGRGGGRAGGGLYSDRRRDLDSIASESEDSSHSGSSGSSSSSSGGGGDHSHSSSGSSDSSETSMERNPNRAKQYKGGGGSGGGMGGNSSSRPMGQPRVGFHADDPFHPPAKHHHRHYRPQESGGGGGGGGLSSPSRSSTIPTTASRGSFFTNDKKKGTEGHVDEERRQRRRRKLKIATIPVAIVLVVVAIVVIVMTVKNDGTGNSEEEQLSTNFDGNSAGEYQISLPTSSPTYSGLFDCPLGKSGAVPIRGCAGFVVCNTLGEAIEPIQYCGQGTLYDVYTSVCNHVDSVVCSTPSLPPDMASSLSPGGLIPATAAPASTPTLTAAITESAPSSSSSSSSVATGAVTLKPTNPGELLGPTVTKDQRLKFLGVSSPGDVTILQISLQNYLNNFYSANNLGTLDEDDVLRSLSDVSITLMVTDFENLRRRRVLVQEVEEDTTTTTTRRRGIVAKHLKTQGKRRKRHLQTTNGNEDPHFIVIYDQTTTFRTTDTSIPIETILSRPFDAEYTAILIDQLQQRDPETFSLLSGVQFVDSNDGGDGTVTTAAPTVTLPRTKRPTPAPTTAPNVDDDAELTPSPAQAEAPPPPTAQPVVEIPPAFLINGITWLDKNENGLYETDLDSLLEEVFVNIRECVGDVWINTTKANSTGQFTFLIEEGEYYLEFYKPSPSEMYDFTVPRVGVDDTEVLDSDVVEKDEIQGQTNCMTVKEGFTQLTNAGYIAINNSSVGSPPSPSPPSSSAPVTGTTAPQYCAFVTGSGSGRQFDFDGCSSPCSNPDRACPNGMLCAYTRDC